MRSAVPQNLLCVNGLIMGAIRFTKPKQGDKTVDYVLGCRLGLKENE